MKKTVVAALAMLMFLPLMAMAQKGFEGTWKMDMSSAQLPQKPDVYVVQNGMYECKTCVPMINVKADGMDQKVTGHPYMDTINVKVMDDRNVESTWKKGGKVVGTSKSSISSDGDTLTSDWTYSGTEAGGTQSGKDISKRVGKAPAKGNMLTGSWRAEKSQMSEGFLTWTYKLNGDELTMTNPTGASFTAKLGGPEAPYKGDPGITTVSVKMVGKDTLEEIDKRDGKVIGISKMTLEQGGKAAKVVYDDKLHGTTFKADVMKQM